MPVVKRRLTYQELLLGGCLSIRKNALIWSGDSCLANDIQ
jgi:hypothetical protein